MEIALIAVCIAIPFFCLFSFREGLKYGGGKVEKIEPIKAIKRNIQEAKSNKETSERMEELTQVIKNMRIYDGTAEGQVKVGKNER